jgi:amidase
MIVPETNSSIPFGTARGLGHAIATRELSAEQVVSAHLERIADVNPALNAIVTLDPEGALAAAREADRALHRGEPVGVLHGLPIAVKDLEDTAGMRTTYGSRAFAEHVPQLDSLLVRRLRAAGAIVIGKTNTPEFGIGSHTFNAVFGATRNPWAPDRSAGGSSGGAGAALAARLVPIADGSDHGGSIRNPSSFNGVVGLRPTPGLVPALGDDAWQAEAVHGPLARTVSDLALMLEAIAGPEPGAPLSFGDPAAFAAFAAAEGLGGVRVAWLPDVGGLPIEPAVREVLGDARRRLTGLGAHVEEISLDLRAADLAFETLRAFGLARQFGSSLPRMRGVMKETLIWNIEQGLGLTTGDLQRALIARSQVFRLFAEMLTRFELVVAPAAQVAPFPVGCEYPTEIDGVQLTSYLEWMRACSRITMTAHPVAAVPAGFTADGLPVGLQLIGAYRGDRRVLELAAAWEAATGLTDRVPPL